MQQLKLFRILMSPSSFSLVATIIVSLAYVIYIGRPHFVDNPVINDYFQGPNGLSMYVWHGTEPVIEWFSKFFSSAMGYYVLLLGAGILAGIVTFTLVQLFSLIFLGTNHFLDAAENASQPMIEMFAQLWLRCLALIGLVLFVGLMLSSLVPMIHLLVDIGASYLRGFDLRGILLYLIAFLVCMGAVHMNLVFVRLLLLRPRVFGSWE